MHILFTRGLKIKIEGLTALPYFFGLTFYEDVRPSGPTTRFGQ